jgi:hypothetical protein
VQQTKIQSKWKAEKRKEGLVTGIQTGIGLKDKEEGNSRDYRQKDDGVEVERDVGITHLKTPPNREEARNLQKEPQGVEVAFSRPTSHTFRAGPLHRRRAFPRSEDSRGRDNTVRGAAQRRRAMGTSWGGGQPNMKLRMDLMLEKIKRDFN